MPFRKKTESISSDKKLVFIIIPVLLLLQITGYVYLRVANRQVAMDALDTQLAVGAKAFGFAAPRRGAYLSRAADLLTKDFGFLDALGTEDKATIESALHNLAGRLGAHLAVLVDLNGDLVAKSVADDYREFSAPLPDSAFETIASKSRDGQPNLFPLASGGDVRLFKWTRTVVRNPTPAGTVMLAFEINQDVLDQFKKITNLDFAYMSAASGEPWVPHASSLSGGVRSVLHAGLQYPNGQQWTEDIAGHDFRALAVDMNGESDLRVVAVVATPFNAALRPFHRIEKTITVASVLLCAASIYTIRRSTRKIVTPLATEVNHDALTGLANRRAFDMRAGRAEAFRAQHGRGFAVMLMDLNKFKSINDTLGHAAGDEVLKEVARRLQPLLRSSDTVARLGGDEFAFVVHADDVGKLRTIAGVVGDQVVQPIRLTDGRDVSVGASIGIAVCPQDGERAQHLLERADAAMYEAKRRGGGFVFADELG